MSIFSFKDSESLGAVRSVDTATVIVEVVDLERLRQLQVNRLVVLQSSRPGQHLVGIIQKITRTAVEAEAEGLSAGIVEKTSEINLARITLIGTVCDKVGEASNVFLRTL